jgi:hypothetical protein
MPQIIEAVAFLDDWMTPEAFDDLGPNGLQVPAERELQRVVTGVTAQRASTSSPPATTRPRRSASAAWASCSPSGSGSSTSGSTSRIRCEPDV